MRLYWELADKDVGMWLREKVELPNTGSSQSQISFRIVPADGASNRDR